VIKVKILYISSVYYPHVGEMEYVIRSVAERLAIPAMMLQY